VYPNNLQDKSPKILVKGNPDSTYLPSYPQGKYPNDYVVVIKKSALKESKKDCKNQSRLIKRDRLAKLSKGKKLNSVYVSPSKRDVNDLLVELPKMMDVAFRLLKQVRESFSINRPIKSSPITSINHHKLNVLYDIPNKQEVDDFLVKHPKLMDFAARAFKQIRRYFSSEVLSLEVTRDPEISNYEQLCVYIHTSLTVKEAVRTLNEFDDRWLLDHLNETNNLFSFNLRFL
jgi:hypothetical protein